MRKTRAHGTFNSEHNVENHKRRRALPPLPGLDSQSKFFERILSVRKMQDLVFITKTVAKNR